MQLIQSFGDLGTDTFPPQLPPPLSQEIDALPRLAS